MDFKNYSEHAKKLGVGQGGYYRLEDGENKLRVVSECEPSVSHFHDKKSYPCTQEESCLYCKQGNKKTYKVLAYVVDRADEDVKLAELPWSVFKAIGELANSSEYGFEGLPPYDLVAKRTGEGMETRYMVMPGKNDKPITKEQEAKLKKKKPVLEISMERITKAQDGDAPAFLEDLPFG